MTTDKTFQINFDTVALAENATQKLVDMLGGKGKIINIRGIAGDSFDETFNSGVMNVINQYPDIEIVAEVYGEWTTSVSQQQVASVLAGLDEVDGVMGQGGDAYGAVMAFEADGRDIPIIIGGNRGNFLNWWKEAKDESGYETFSWACNPWDGAAALYVAVDILKGDYNIPFEMIMGGLEITQDMVDDFYGLDDDFVAFKGYDHDWIVENFYN